MRDVWRGQLGFINVHLDSMKNDRNSTSVQRKPRYLVGKPPWQFGKVCNDSFGQISRLNRLSSAESLVSRCDDNAPPVLHWSSLFA